MARMKMKTESFQSFWMSDRTDDNDSAILDWERGPLDASLPSVVAFLKRSPGIVASVRFLALHHKDGTGPTNSKILCRILNQLPSLTNLDLVDIIEVGENYQPPPGPIVNRHLDRLSFTFYHTDSATRSLKSVVRVLAFFRSVNILSLQGILEDEALADTDMVGLPLPLYALRHLEIRDVAPQSFISAMQSKSLLRNIETLQMEDTRYVNRDAQALDNLVVQVSSTLLHFVLPACKPSISYSLLFLAKYTLVITSVNRNELRSTTLLVPLRKLETIYFKIYTIISVGWRNAICLLPTIQCVSTLHTVIFCLSVESEANTIAERLIGAAPQIIHLEDILLALTKTTSLRQVILSFKTPQWVRMKPEVLSCFTNVFPRLVKNGILKVYLDHLSTSSMVSESSFIIVLFCN